MDGHPASMFDAALEGAELSCGVRVAKLDLAACEAQAEAVFAGAFRDRPSTEREALYEQDARARADQLMALEGEAMLHHMYGFFADDELVGVYEGRQERRAEYDMRRTAIVPEWQRRGIYRSFLPKVVDAASAAGFLKVTSRHGVDNNGILIAKLAQGFVIDGLTTSLRSGLQVVPGLPPDRSRSCPTSPRRAAVSLASVVL